MDKEASGKSFAEIPTHVTGAYRRALWSVATLNLLMGIAEAASGYFAGSQALKADSLDFLGDGVITGLGLVALNWGTAPRAYAALTQGVFLALMGAGILAVTVYRMFFIQMPEVAIMGGFGFLALIVNTICAVILLRHRKGDSNVRAVWLFSRNDAIGNALVIAAAVAVAFSGSPWPDLVVAIAIAALFVHSAFRIITDARGEIASAS